MSARDDYPELGRIANGFGVEILEDAEEQCEQALVEIGRLRAYVQHLLTSLREAPTWKDRPFAVMVELTQITGWIRRNHARLHAPACHEANGCQCGLADLPMWGDDRLAVLSHDDTEVSHG